MASRSIDAAVEHGARRRAQAVPDSLLSTEFHVLRESVWLHLIEAGGPTRPITQAILHPDSLITHAVNACMWGYYPMEVESPEKWARILENILQSSLGTTRRAHGRVRPAPGSGRSQET